MKISRRELGAMVAAIPLAAIKPPISTITVGEWIRVPEELLGFNPIDPGDLQAAFERALTEGLTGLGENVVRECGEVFSLGEDWEVEVK